MSIEQEQKEQQEQMERCRAMVEITDGDVVYDYELVNIDGAAFRLFREPHHTDADIAAATDRIKTDRDVVGRIKVISLAADHANYEAEKPLLAFVAATMTLNRHEAPNWARQWRGKAEGRERGEGLANFSAKVTAMLPMFEPVIEWCSPYRRVWRCDALRTLISYCEDDLNATQYFEDARYAKYIQRAAEVYRTCA
jgi:hypothetical protein